MKHFAIVAPLVLISTWLVHTGLTAIGLLPVEASLQAVSIDAQIQIQLWLISFLFSLIVVTLFYGLVVFRRRPGETGDGAHIEGSTRLEIAWTLIPLITVLVLAYLGAQSLRDIRRVDPSAMEVDVTAGQWYWSFAYPDSGVTSDTLYLPINRQVLLRMNSKDVIHSFWVPQFRVKQDLVPGQTTELRVTPTLAGEYPLLCTELCGTSHAYMVAKVKVVSDAEFAGWISQQTTAVVDPVVQGRQLSQQYCAACHSVDGSQKVGPTWLGLAGSNVPLADGSSVLADEAYLKNSILNPNLNIVAGYSPNVMPSFSGTLDDAKVSALVAYIQSLGK